MTRSNNPTGPSTSRRHGARSVNIADNERIPMLVEMSDALSRAAADPAEVLRIFSWRSNELYGPRGYMSISTRGLAPGEYSITRLIRLDGSDQLVVADPLMNDDTLPVHRGGFFGDIIGSSYPELIHHLDVSDDPVVGDALAPYGALMAIPLFDEGMPVNWAVFLREDAEGFTVLDLEQAILRANLVGTAVKNALITRELRSAHARIREEIEHIASIQRALLPETLPNIPGLRIAASYETFDTAGGDYYDFRPMSLVAGSRDPDPNGPWGILIADASGHGPSAAVLMAMLQSIVHAYPTDPAPSGPAEVLQHANEQLCRKRLETSFVTAFLAMYDPRTRRVVYARAGHHPPLLKDSKTGAAISQLDAVGGIPLGVLEDTIYEQAEISFDQHKTLLLYTDGITEAMSPDGHMFDVKGVERALQSCPGDPDGVVASIIKPLDKHVCGGRPTDDQTIVAIQSV